MAHKNLQSKLKKIQQDAAKAAQEDPENIKLALEGGMDEQRLTMLEAAREKIGEFKEKIIADQRAKLALERQLHRSEIAIVQPYFAAKKKIQQCERVDSCIELANSLSEQAGVESQDALNKLKAVLEQKSQETVTNEDILNIDTAYGAMEKLKNSTELQRIFDKLLIDSPLSDEDYETLINHLDPQAMESTARVNPRNLEKMAVSLLVNFMDPDQRIELVRKFMESNKRAQTGELIDVFLVLGKLSIGEASTLFQEAADAGAITNEQHEIYKERMSPDSEYYSKLQENARQQMELELAEGYRGMTNENIVSRFVGYPALAFVGMCWGFTTFAVNTLVSRRRGEPIADTLARFGKSYALPGLAVGLAGLEIHMGLLKSRGEEAFAGPLSEAISSDPNESMLVEIYNSPELKEYLKNGGFNTIKQKWDELIRNKEEKYIRLSDLIDLEENPDQQEILERLRSESHAEDRINDKLTTVAHCAYQLELYTNAKFQEKINNLTEITA
jgi:hypothetical protein